MKSVNDIAGNVCAGCGLCRSVIGEDIIDFGFNTDGFLRPQEKVALNNEQTKIFNNVCPSINAKIKNSPDYDKYWGPIKSICAGYSSNSEARYKGASGGALSGIAIHLLKSKKVSAILHIGPSDKNPIENEYKISTSVNQIVSNAGSRYSPSAPLINILNIIDGYESLAFIGKPCDVLALRNLTKMNSKANSIIKYTLSFMCAGVPSLKGTQQIIHDFGVKESNVTNLKYRGEGWPGKFSVTNSDDEKFEMSYNDSWGNVLNKYLQFRCKICADGTGEFADITCADAWESSNDGYPSFEERQGKSLIITRTNLGLELLESAVSNDDIILTNDEITSKDIEGMQPYQKDRKQKVLARILPLTILGHSKPNYNIRLLLRASLKSNYFKLAYNSFGMLRRLINQRNK